MFFVVVVCFVDVVGVALALALSRDIALPVVIVTDGFVAFHVENRCCLRLWCWSLLMSASFWIVVVCGVFVVVVIVLVLAFVLDFSCS